MRDPSQSLPCLKKRPFAQLRVTSKEFFSNELFVYFVLFVSFVHCSYLKGESKKWYGIIQRS
jgi:hypothetical protein